MGGVNLSLCAIRPAKHGIGYRCSPFHCQSQLSDLVEERDGFEFYSASGFVQVIYVIVPLYLYQTIIFVI